MSEVPAPSGGWTKSLAQLPSISISTIDQYLLFDVLPEDGKSAGAHKGRSKGWTLWRNENVRNVVLNSSEGVCFVKANIRALMKLSMKYEASVQLDPLTGSVTKCTCQCKAGKGGRCKHVAALLFRLWDLKMQKIPSVPPDKSVTDVPAYWKGGGANVDGKHLSLSNLGIGKQQAPSVGSSEALADITRQKIHIVVDQPVTVVPASMQLVPREDIEKFCKELKSSEKAPMLTPVIERNGYMPV